MCCPRRRFALASELATVPLMRPFTDASASMKKFTVEPVPTPTTMSSSTYFNAASAAAFFCALASMGEGYRECKGQEARGKVSFGIHEERRVSRPHPRREGVRRGGGKPAGCPAVAFAAHGQPRAAQARGQAGGVLLQAARRVQQDGEPRARAARARRDLRIGGQPRAGRGARGA